MTPVICFNIVFDFRVQENLEEDNNMDEMSCNICLGKNSAGSNQIVICDKCGQGKASLCSINLQKAIHCSFSSVF